MLPLSSRSRAVSATTAGGSFFSPGLASHLHVLAGSIVISDVDLSQQNFQLRLLPAERFGAIKTRYPIDVPTWAALNGRLFVGLPFKQIEPSNK
jgi:hypothetical protein